MIRIDAVWLASEPLDMRAGIDSAQARVVKVFGAAYTLKRWGALIVHGNDARIPVDNNAVENMMRPIALGRKNWLFIGSQQAGSMQPF